MPCNVATTLQGIFCYRQNTYKTCCNIKFIQIFVCIENNIYFCMICLSRAKSLYQIIEKGNMAMTINEIQDEVVAEFNDFTDWMDKYQMLIDLGNELQPLDEKYKNDSNLIDGCQSRVWVQCDYTDGKMILTAESDALIVKGIIALLVRVLSGHTPSEILNADLYFIDKIGLKEHLSPTRSNGLLAMIKQIRLYALAYSQKKS